MEADVLRRGIYQVTFGIPFYGRFINFKFTYFLLIGRPADG